MKLNSTELRRLAYAMREKLGCDAGHVADIQSQAAYLGGEFHKFKHWQNVAAVISELDAEDQLSSSLGWRNGRVR